MPSTPPVGEPAPSDGRLPAAALAAWGERGFSIYVHVPFCASRCGYCDFNTYTAADLGAEPGTRQDAYVAAVAAEVELVTQVLQASPPVQSVFFGGGTPTMLAAADLAGLLNKISERFDIAPDAEITTEANPESVDREYLDTLVAAGFNRLSLGMQSARESVLAVLERRHHAGKVSQVVAAARDAGFTSVSLDLIYGTPTESLADWQASLVAAIETSPDHISAYSLIVEEGTRLAAQVRRGDLPPVDPDVHAAYYEQAEQILAAAGFANYEISNWAKPGHESRHNLAYWRGSDWWGIGPGAHSHVGGVRWWNVRHPRGYAARLSQGLSPAQAREVLTDDERHVEDVLLGLRLAEGLNLDLLTRTERSRIPGLVADGLAVVADHRLRLTLRGRLLADGITRDLLDD